eukprot:9593000-Ditylum_brightwellii.AAC.1
MPTMVKSQTRAWKDNQLTSTTKGVDLRIKGKMSSTNADSVKDDQQGKGIVMPLTAADVLAMTRQRRKKGTDV